MSFLITDSANQPKLHLSLQGEFLMFAYLLQNTEEASPCFDDLVPILNSIEEDFPRSESHSFTLDRLLSVLHSYSELNVFKLFVYFIEARASSILNISVVSSASTSTKSKARSKS